MRERAGIRIILFPPAAPANAHQTGVSVARPLSWFNRITPIARTVTESARSHYARKDLQELFEIQPRSAQNLMAAMPVITVGNVHLVERESLSALLAQLDEADDPARTLARLRGKGTKPRKRRLRVLSLNDVSANLDSIPENVSLKLGELTVRFDSVDQLAEAMVCLAALLRDHLDEFATRYEPLPEPAGPDRDENKEVHLDMEYLRSLTQKAR